MANGFKGLLITPEQKQQAAYQGLLNLGTNLMAAGGYSDRPTSFAQALGKGGQGFMQGYQGSLDRTRQQQMQNLQAQQAQTGLELQKEKIKQLQTGGGVTYGKTPVWGTDAKGQRVLGVIGDDGSFKKIDTKDFTPQRTAVTVKNIGGQMVGFDEFGQPVTTTQKTLPPEATPEVKAAQAAATAKGKGSAESASELSAAEASLPQLEGAVKTLKSLGEKATYTLAGQAADEARKQMGLEPSEGAVARSAYIAHVKNNVLPLLRQTFGAAFTAKEGESLLATLGDPDMAPEEKNAVLDAFIENKRAQIGVMKRKVGKENEIPKTPLPTDALGMNDDFNSVMDMYLND